MMFHCLGTVFREEVDFLKRDWTTGLITAAPLIGLLFFGYALDTNITSISTVVLDLNQDRESRQLVNEFANTRYFALVGEVGSDQELRDAIVAGRAQVGIKIPADYSANLQSGRQGQVQVVIDGSDSRTALQILNSSQQLGFLKSLEREGISPAMFSVDVRPHVLFNPGLRSDNFFIPGLIGVLLQLWTLCLVPLNVQGRRERSSVSMAGFVLGKLSPYLFMGFILTGLMLVIMVYLFNVPIAGSIPLLLALSLLFLAAALGVAFVISTWIEQVRGALAAALVFFLFSILLSGFVFPQQSMPAIISTIGLLVPVTYSMEITRGIVLRGAGIATFWKAALALVGFSVGLGTVGALGLKKRWR